MCPGMRSRIRALYLRLRREHDSPARLAAAVALGLFVGIVPFYGVQTPICVGLASILRLNRLVAVGAAQVSNPLFAPFLIAAGIALGETIRHRALHRPDLAEAADLVSQLAWLSGRIPDLYLSCLLGDTLIAVVAAAIGAAVTWRMVTRWRAA